MVVSPFLPFRWFITKDGDVYGASCSILLHLFPMYYTNYAKNNSCQLVCPCFSLFVGGMSYDRLCVTESPAIEWSRWWEQPICEQRLQQRFLWNVTFSVTFFSSLIHKIFINNTCLRNPRRLPDYYLWTIPKSGVQSDWNRRRCGPKRE